MNFDVKFNDKFLRSYRSILNLVDEYNTLDSVHHELLVDLTSKNQTILDRIDEFNDIRSRREEILHAILDICSHDITLQVESDLSHYNGGVYHVKSGL